MLAGATRAAARYFRLPPSSNTGRRGRRPLHRRAQRKPGKRLPCVRGAVSRRLTEGLPPHQWFSPLSNQRFRRLEYGSVLLFHTGAPQNPSVGAIHESPVRRTIACFHRSPLTFPLTVLSIKTECPPGISPGGHFIITLSKDHIAVCRGDHAAVGRVQYGKEGVPMLPVLPVIKGRFLR